MATPLTLEVTAKEESQHVCNYVWVVHVCRYIKVQTQAAVYCQKGCTMRYAESVLLQCIANMYISQDCVRSDSVPTATISPYILRYFIHSHYSS